jgi:hypothetical protein
MAIGGDGRPWGVGFPGSGVFGPCGVGLACCDGIVWPGKRGATGVGLFCAAAAPTDAKQIAAMIDRTLARIAVAPLPYG